MWDMEQGFAALTARYPDTAESVVWFVRYAQAHVDDTTRGPLELKLRHSARVVDNALRISDSLQEDETTKRTMLLAALFHDVGRFPQFCRWRTFRDPDSTNHGRLGARVLREESVLDTEDPEVQRLTLLAVGLHNRRELPCRLPDRPRLITNVVRDADKIDILSIFSNELRKPEPSPDVVLHVAREKDQWTPAIADMVLAGQVPDYRQLRFVNDFIMLLGSWMPSLSFAESRNLVREAGTVESLLEQLPEHPRLEALKKTILGFTHTQEQPDHVRGQKNAVR